MEKEKYNYAGVIYLFTEKLTAKSVAKNAKK